MRRWVTEADVQLILLCRSGAKAEMIAADLKVRGPNAEVQVVECEFIGASAIRRQVDAIVDEGPIDTVLIAHGSLPDQAQCQQDLGSAADALTVNGISPVLFAEAFAYHMANANRGTLGIIGSVAGDRGRKSNYVYGAAKGLVTRYAQGMQHRFANTGVNVVLIKPGPTSTPMTAHLAERGARLANVEEVAQDITEGMRAGKHTIYTPTKWALIMMVIRHLPRMIFNRLDI